MRWTRASILLTTALCLAIAFSAAAPEQQLTVYTAQTSYSLPVLDREGRAYIGLTDLLTPLGATALRGKGKSKEWKVNLDKAEARLTEGKDKATIRSSQVDLGGKVLVEGGRVLVPLGAALPLLSRMMNVAVDFHQPSRRIFVGDVLTRFHAEFKNGDQPSLVLTFSQPLKRLDVNREEDRSGLLFTHTNKIALIFRKDPVVADISKQQFGDGAIQSLVFAEENGFASITVSGNVNLQIIRGDDGKTITLQPEAPVAATLEIPDNPSPSLEGQHHPQEFFVMIDPSHGGYDKGVSFGGKVVEKDITLRLARELRKELQERGIPSRMLRDSDVDIALERRAEITNEQHAGLYVALHAGRPGKGVRVYAPLLADSQSMPAGRFLPWESAQSGALPRSQSTAQKVAVEFRKKGWVVANLGMPVRPLNNIVAPAIAVELAPEGDDPLSLESAKRQNAVASAIAAGIAQARSQLGGRP